MKILKIEPGFASNHSNVISVHYYILFKGPLKEDDLESLDTGDFTWVSMREVPLTKLQKLKFLTEKSSEEQKLIRQKMELMKTSLVDLRGNLYGFDVTPEIESAKRSANIGLAHLSKEYDLVELVGTWVDFDIDFPEWAESIKPHSLRADELPQLDKVGTYVRIGSGRNKFRQKVEFIEFSEKLTRKIRKRLRNIKKKERSRRID